MAKKAKKLIFIIIITILSFINTGAAWADPSIAGPTGGFLTPSPEVCRPGKFSGSLYLQNYSIQRASSESNRIFTVNGLYGISKALEVGFSKDVDSMNSNYDPGLSLNVKYLFPDSKALKVAAGMVVETDSNSYSSAYIVTGQDAAYCGLGVNFGGHRAYPLNRAHYGAYDFTEMAPNNFFFIAGANFDLKVANLYVEYNSDSFAMGVKASTGEGYYVNLGYISESDYDLLHRTVYGDSYSRSKVVLGVSGTF
ncbi:MAG: hypothetical protein QMC67_11695 [Candidatus Wallbacteria bacterium]